MTKLRPLAFLFCRLGLASTTDLQARIDALPPEGGSVHVIAGVNYVTRPLSLRGRSGITLWGDGPADQGSQINCDFPKGGNHRARQWPVVDMTGARFCTLRDLSVNAIGDPESGAGCAILMARPVAPGSSGNHVLQHVVVNGWFGAAAVVCAASECNQLSACMFATTNPAAHVLVVCNGPFPGVTTPGGYGSSTMCQLGVRDCHFAQYGARSPNSTGLEARTVRGAASTWSARRKTSCSRGAGCPWATA